MDKKQMIKIGLGLGMGITSIIVGSVIYKELKESKELDDEYERICKEFISHKIDPEAIKVDFEAFSKNEKTEE